MAEVWRSWLAPRPQFCKYISVKDRAAQGYSVDLKVQLYGFSSSTLVLRDLGNMNNISKQ